MTFLGGTLDYHQTVPGKLADFNMWRHEKTAAQLNSETCEAQGDVVSWNTLLEKGSSTRTNELFAGCAGKSLFFT